MTDPQAECPEFFEQFHKLFAKCQNVLRGRWENFWANEQTSMVQLVDESDVVFPAGTYWLARFAGVFVPLPAQ